MEKEDEPAPAHQPEPELPARRIHWYRRLLHAMALSRPSSRYRRLPRTFRRSTRRRARVLRLGNRRPAFRLRAVISRIRWRWLSPLALLARLRDAYVDLMLSASAKVASSSEGLAFGGCAYPPNPLLCPPSSHHTTSTLSQIASRHEKLLLEFYFSMAQQPIPCPAVSTA